MYTSKILGWVFLCHTHNTHNLSTTNQTWMVQSCMHISSHWLHHWTNHLHNFLDFQFNQFNYQLSLFSGQSRPSHMIWSDFGLRFSVTCLFFFFLLICFCLSHLLPSSRPSASYGPLEKNWQKFSVGFFFPFSFITTTTTIQELRWRGF